MTRTLRNGNTLTVTRDERGLFCVAEHRFGAFLRHAFATFSKREAHEYVELQVAP